MCRADYTYISGTLFTIKTRRNKPFNKTLMDQSFINRLAALAITSLLLVIGLVLLKTATLNDVTRPQPEGISITIYEDVR